MARYVFGKNPVVSSLQSRGARPRRLYYQRGAEGVEAPVALARRLGIPAEARDRAWFERLAKTSPHQGLALELPDFEYADYEHMLKQAAARTEALLVALDQLEDPHNLGALARSADAVGALGLIIPQDRSVHVTAAAEKAASGAFSSLPVAKVVNLGRALEQCKEAGFWVYGLAGEAEASIFDEKFAGKICLVLGAEGKGLRDGVARRCDKLLKIPMGGSVGSLNVSVAGGIAMFEVVRQRNLTAK